MSSTLTTLSYPKFKGTPGYKLYFYEAGTSTLKNTYTDATGNIPNSNPVILDANGEAAIWMKGFYKVKYTDAADVQQWVLDNINFQAFLSTAAALIDEWQSFAHTWTYVSGTQFSTSIADGDTRSIYQVGRRIEATVSTGFVYGEITANNYATGITTVTIEADSGGLDAGLGKVRCGVISINNRSLPFRRPYREIVLTSSASQIDFTGLNLDIHKGYFLECIINNLYTNPAGLGINLYFNSDVVATNYWRESINADGVTLTSARTNDCNIAGLYNLFTTYITGHINRPSGTFGTTAIVHSVADETSIKTRHTGLKWITTSNVTSISINTGGSYFGIGSIFRIWR